MQNTLLEQHLISFFSVIRDYIELTKPRIVALLVFTTLVALVIATPPGQFPVQVLLVTFAGGWLAAAGASVLNQYLDRELDGQMSRTKNRPIPMGRVQPAAALIYGLVLLSLAFLALGVGVNWISAGLAMLGVFYYVVIYTLLLKRNTVLNIVIGGGAGAMPVLVGWTAATGHLAPGAFLLYAIVFFWTPPHSWALAALVNHDYSSNHIPMLPAVMGMGVAAVQIIWYALILVILTFLPFPLGILGPIYFLSAVILGAGLLYYALRFYRLRTRLAAKQLYKYSSLYLALLFLLMIVDHLVGLSLF